MSRRRLSPSTRLPLEKILKRIDRQGQDNTLRRRIAALVLYHRRSWTPERIAQHFEWPLEETTAWLKAGEFHARGPEQRSN